MEPTGSKAVSSSSPRGDKANLFATIGPPVAGGVVLSGHTDVVPVEGQAWTSDPFTLTERDGPPLRARRDGHEGFDALVLALVPEMVQAALRRPIHIALSYDEELACQGAPSMVRAMAQSIPTPAAVIVGEPTRHAVVTGHKASVQLETRVTGRAVHSSRIDQGVSAVMTAARLIAWHRRRRWKRTAARADPTNPFEPPYTTLHCGMVSGRHAPPTSLPRRPASPATSAPFRRKARWTISTATAPMLRRVEARMKAIAPEAGIAIELVSEIPGLRPESEGTAEALMRALTGDNASHVVAYGTEAGLFQGAGWSTVVCGPGDIAQAHQPDEYIEVERVRRPGSGASAPDRATCARDGRFGPKVGLDRGAVPV